MNTEAVIHLPLLVNTLGHIAGVAAFAGFLYFLWRSHRRSPRSDVWLPAGAALLALLWNAGSLGVLALADAPSLARRGMIATSFAALSLLPAVLLHVSLGSRRGLLRGVGYGLGILALVMHLAEVFGNGGEAHRFGLHLITFGFGFLAILTAGILWNDQQQRKGAGMRVLGAMALLLFAVSFVHFGESHGSDAWAHELLFHHAGIPLSLFVLLQDYRFLLLDVFIRFLGNALLAVAVSVGLMALASQMEFDRTSPDGGFFLALAIAGVGTVLFGFAALRGHVQKCVECRVLRRSHLQATLQKLRAKGGDAVSEQDLLKVAANEIASFVQAHRAEILEGEVLPAGTGEKDLCSQVLDRSFASLSAEQAWAEVVVPLRFTEGDRLFLLLSERAAGRRYLSEDLKDLDRLAAEIVEQVARRRRSELQGLATQAELQALRAQINPHFLFNALNALYGLIPRTAPKARRTLVNLAEIFRYSLQGNRQHVPLEEELRVIQAYLEVERLRLGSRLQTEIETSPEARRVEIPALSIQPLVENAVKHGITRNAGGGHVRLDARVVDGNLQVTVSDDGPGFQVPGPSQNGYGLDNVRRRLQLYYGEKGQLHVRSAEGHTGVGFRVPLEKPT